MRTWLLYLLLLPCCTVSATEWQSYPDTLPVFNYDGDLLRQNWPQLTAVTQVEYPDSSWIKAMMQRYPRLAIATLEMAGRDNAPASVKAAIHQTNYEPLAQDLQQVWRLHFAGKFREAYELGMTLGPFGQIPAVYSRLIHATLLVDDKNDKLAEFDAAAGQSNEGLTLAPDYDFAKFGLVYARVRTLELLDTGEARSSGYIPFAQDELEALHKRHPHQAIYPATQGGLEAGIVERVGSFLGSITYGATESGSIEHFDNAMASESTMPVIYYEYAVALGRLDEKEYRRKIRKLAETCTYLPVYTAEEALNQFHCQHLLSSKK